MCGISGYVSKKDEVSKPVYQTFLQALMVNESRGSQSTGMAFMKEDGNVIYLKSTDPARIFAKTNKDMIDKYPGVRAMIGHTRYATTGAITEENAHPIIKKNIVGVHNGMVHNYGYLGDFKVDSEAIFYLLSEFDGDAEKALPMLDGVFAIAWFDQISKSISIIRDHNPLFVLETQDGYFFDSQAKTIRALKDIYGGVAYDLDTNKLWTFKIGKDTCEAVGKKVIIGSDPYKPEGIISIKIGHRTVEFDFLNAKKVTDRNVKCEACGKKSRHKVTQFFEDAKTVLCEPCVDKYLERSNNE